MAAYAGLTVTHLKPHGALYNMAAGDEAYAMAIARAVRTVDPSIIFLALGGSAMERAAEALGLRFACEAFADRLYEDDGTLTSRAVEGAVIHDPEVAAARVVRMVLDQEIVSRHGTRLPRRIHSICVHGDEPGAVRVARAVRSALEAAGVGVVPLPEMDLA